MRRASIYITIISIIIISSGIGLGDWDNWASDSQHTSAVDDNAPYIEDDELLVWEYDTGDDVSSSPIIIDDLLFVGNDDRMLMMFNISGGNVERLDEFEFNSSVDYLASYDGKIIAVSSKELICFEVDEEDSLDRIWYFTPDEGKFSCAPSVSNGRVVIASSWYDYDTKVHKGKVVALDIAEGVVDGVPYWEYDFNSKVTASPAIYNERVYLASGKYNESEKTYSGRVVCLNLDSGNHIWTHECNNRVQSSPTIENGLLFFQDRDNSNNDIIIALDVSSGQKRWSTVVDGDMSSTFAANDERLYLSSDEGLIYCFEYSKSGGTLDWSYQIDYYEFSAAPSLVGDMLLIGGEDRTMYAFDADPSDGVDEGIEDPVGKSYDLLWKYNVKEEITTQAAVDNGVVYFGSEDNHLYALGNNPPGVDIKVSSSEVEPGETVEFTGQVWDEKEPVEYRWYCDELGSLSSDRNFTKSFDKGEYVVEFQARDEYGEWSNVAKKSILVEKVEEKSFPWLLVVIIVAVIGAAGGVGFYFYSQKNEGEGIVREDSEDNFKYWE